MTGGVDPLIVALDVPDAPRALALADRVRGHVGMCKVGLELFVAAGPAIVGEVARRAPVFLDLKFHDIPATVAGAARGAARLGVAMFTVHGAGGATMIEAAAAAAREGADVAGVARPLVIAVTVLSSVPEGVDDAVARARDAVGAGADGVVVSGTEVARVRAALGPDAVLVVPGIRPAGTDLDDQRRVLTPREAMAAGATRIVVGRPVTGADDPAAAADAIVASLA